MILEERKTKKNGKDELKVEARKKKDWQGLKAKDQKQQQNDC